MVKSLNEPRGNNATRPSRRVVLLGASNVTRGISTVVETARRIWGRPLEVLGAFGHGRSYGQDSVVLGRRLTGILHCGLWQSLAERQGVPTAALLADIGNDLLYEVPVAQVIDWVTACLDRLDRAEARVVMTRLPVDNFPSLTRWRYRLLRTVFVPGCRLSLAAIVERANELDERLLVLAGQRGIAVVPHRREWYGFDPIHIMLRHWPDAWREILAPWSDQAELPAPAERSASRWLYLRHLAPHERRWLGITQRRSQPAGRLADGTTVALY